MIVQAVFLEGWFLFSLGCSLVSAAGVTYTASSNFHPYFSTNQSQTEQAIISPYWPPEIQEVSTGIEELADSFGFHPDLIASVFWQESNFQAINSTRLGIPNIRHFNSTGQNPWGTSPNQFGDFSGDDSRWKLTVLSYAVQRAGGDLGTGLSAYYGGWDHINDSLPREYASRVIDDFARAILLSQNISTEISTGWTIGIEIRHGNVPEQTFVLVEPVPTGEINLYPSVIIYDFVDQYGRSYHVKGYVIPVSLVEISSDPKNAIAADQLEPQLRAYMGDKDARKTGGNFRLLIACLPTLDRLKHRTTSRWFRPTFCPPNSRE